MLDYVSEDPWKLWTLPSIEILAQIAPKPYETNINYETKINGQMQMTKVLSTKVRFGWFKGTQIWYGQEQSFYWPWNDISPNLTLISA